MKNNLKHIWAYIQEDKKVYLRVVFFSIVIGLLEFLGISSLMPVVSLFLNGTIDNMPKMIEPIFNELGVENVVFLFIFLIIAQTLVAILNEQYFVTQIARWRTSITIEYIKNILNAKFENFDKLKPGEIEVMITRNIGFAMKIRHRTAIFISDYVLAIFYIAIAIYISVYTIFLFLMLGVIYLIINRITIKLRVKYSQIAKDKYILSAKHVSEYFADIRTLLSYENKHFLGKVETEVYDASIAQRSTDKINVFIKHIFQPIMILLIFLTIYISKNILFFDNATILVMLYIFYRAAPKMIEVAKGYGEIIGDSPSDVTPDIKKWAQYSTEISTNKKIPEIFDINIQAKSLSIYDNELIKNVNIDINDKEIVSFIGKSGSGKSTILDTVCGFLELKKGSLKIDNLTNGEIDFKGLLLNKVALVRQEAKIISGTIAENISYLSEDINRQEVEKYVKLLDLDQFLNDRNGIDTIIKSRGEGLSAGQKQRIILARALYKSPSILVLDEPTSNLDKKTEKDIIEILLTLKGKLTILIASHSEDVINISDKVYKIEDKKITQLK